MILAFIQNLHIWEILLILGLGLLLFGKRLPEVGKNLGKGIVEFRKGLKSVEEEVNEASSPPPYRPPLTSSGSDPRVTQQAAQEPAPPAQPQSNN